jgi:pyrrolidone-carboxylate peptidase
MPVHQPISHDSVQQLCCKLQLEPIAQQLSDMFPCEVSHDPGKFICNYIYYRSLMAANPRRFALFVHVPPFAVVAKVSGEEGEGAIHLH